MIANGKWNTTHGLEQDSETVLLGLNAEVMGPDAPGVRDTAGVYRVNLLTVSDFSITSTSLVTTSRKI